jgi:hypothetical protein
VAVVTCAGYAPREKEKGVRKLKTKEDVWVLTPNEEDLKAGAHYAAVSLPWTFNRMMLNTSSAGQQHRALNIAKGVVGQEMLKREMARRGIKAQTQRKSHRDEDLFDFHADIQGTLTKLDLKSVNYFTDYAPLGREPFSADLLLKYSGYADADWRTFFPMLVPHTQIEQSKEGYCFAIASSIDLRKDISTKRTAYALTAFPYGEHLAFLSSKKLCLLREEANKGFFLEFLYEANSLLTSEITLSVVGEWAGKAKVAPVKLLSGVSKQVGPFSCISSFQMEKQSYDQFYGGIEILVKKNEFTKPVLNTLKRNTNVVPKAALVFARPDFCNLFLPTDYTLYVVGWTRKDEFLQACRQYTGWVWPMDSVDKFKNQAWSQITEDDQRRLEATGFGSSIQEKPRMLRAGWLKTTGRGGGACCYVFPNIGANGGVKETNLYILARDLYTMDSLK